MRRAAGGGYRVGGWDESPLISLSACLAIALAPAKRNLGALAAPPK
jgi:hypothetical protein